MNRNQLKRFDIPNPNPFGEMTMSRQTRHPKTKLDLETSGDYLP